jgi:hypothetical protein
MRRSQKTRDDRSALTTPHEALRELRTCAHKKLAAAGSKKIRGTGGDVTGHESQVTTHYSPITPFLIGSAAIKNRRNRMKTKGRLPF